MNLKNGLLKFIIYYTGILKIIIFLRTRFLKKYRVLVLGYHSIAEFNPKFVGKIRFVTRPDSFERQVRYLKKHFKVLSLEKLVDALKSGNLPKSDCVLITFDDGYKDNFIAAVPILKKYRLPAAFFPVEGRIGEANYLNWEEILEMKNSGFTFGAHTLSHPHLTQIDEQAAKKEITEAKYLLEEKLRSKVDYFAYPYGEFNQHIVGLVKDAGYLAAFSIIDGSCDKGTDLFLVNRNIILRQPFYAFAADLEGIFENCA